MNNNEYNEDDEYCFIDEYEMNYDGYDGDILSACIAEYATDNEEYIAGALSADEDETQYPPTRNFENSWGFIDHNDLSVEFKDTTLPPKCPQKAVGICLLILAQAKKYYFKRIRSKLKQNLLQIFFSINLPRVYFQKKKKNLPQIRYKIIYSLHFLHLHNKNLMK